MGQSALVLLCSISLALSLAAATRGQESSEQRINFLRKILRDDVDVLTALDLLNDEEEKEDSDEVQPFQIAELSPQQKRFCGYKGCGKRNVQRKKQRKQPHKRLFCNFGGCFNGKRSVSLAGYSFE